MLNLVLEIFLYVYVTFTCIRSVVDLIRYFGDMKKYRKSGSETTFKVWSLIQKLQKEGAKVTIDPSDEEVD